MSGPRRARRSSLCGEIRRLADDEVLATAEAIYVKMSEAQKRMLIEKYGDSTPALAKIVALTGGRE
jgi:hypothetical protein